MARIVVVILLLLAIVAASVASDRPLPRADLVVYNGSDVNTLDPQRMTWMPDLRVARAVFEPLVRTDVFDRDFSIIPGVAERWTVSDDQRTYTFTLREDARWSNGESVTSEHFKAGWRRALVPDMGSKYVEFLMTIDGAREFYDWRAEQLTRMESGESPYADGNELWQATLAQFDQTVAIETPDDRTLRVTLERPVAYFLELTAFMTFSPIYPPLLAQYERPDPSTGRLSRGTGWTKPGVLISNGPFLLREWRFKRDMRLEKNPYYWDRARIGPESIQIPSIGDPNAAVLAFETGAVDFMAEMTAPYRGDMVSDKLKMHREHADEMSRFAELGLDQFEMDRRLPDDPRLNIHAVPAFGTYFYNFNCRPTLADGRANPFADARVRRAFAMTVDKAAIVNEVRRVGDAIATTLIPPGSIGGYDAPAGLRCVSDAATDDERQAIIAEARALLAEAGYPDPANDFPVTVELLFNKASGHDLIAQVIAKGWAKYLGVGTRLAQKELKVFRNDLTAGNFVTSRAGWYGDYGDPTTFLDLSRTGNGNNDRGFSHEPYDRLLEQAEGETDPEARLALLEQAEAMLVAEQVPLIPIFHYATVYMFDPNVVTGVSTHPRGKQQLWELDMMTRTGGNEPVMKPMRYSAPGIEALDGSPISPPYPPTLERQAEDAEAATGSPAGASS